MIRSFADRRTLAIFAQRYVRSVNRELQRRAFRKLRILHSVDSIQDLAGLPGNRLEQLRGQHSIRVNRQWRICFTWRDGDAYDVEFVDYHA